MIMRSQHIARWLVLFLYVVSLALGATLPIRPAYACSCASPPSVEQAVEQATAVFTGEVIAIEQNATIPPRKKVVFTRSFPFVTVEEQWGVFAGPSRITFDVFQVWKGPANHRVTIEGFEQDGAGCGYSFTAAQTYVVYARRNAEMLENTLCGRTKLVQEAQADMMALGRGIVVAPISTQPSEQPQSPVSIFAGAGAIFLLILALFILYKHRGKRPSQT
jgi:hypothetical protein